MARSFLSVLLFIQITLVASYPGRLYQLATTVQPVLSYCQMAPRPILGLLRLRHSLHILRTSQVRS